jgi:hypothetical protein
MEANRTKKMKTFRVFFLDCGCVQVHNVEAAHKDRVAAMYAGKPGLRIKQIKQMKG